MMVKMMKIWKMNNDEMTYGLERACEFGFRKTVRPKEERNIWAVS